MPVFRWLPLARQFPPIATISGRVGALEMPSNRDVLVMVLLTVLAAKPPESAPEIGLSSAPVDRENFGTLGTKCFDFNNLG
jgi:hypothetical protein